MNFKRFIKKTKKSLGILPPALDGIFGNRVAHMGPAFKIQMSFRRNDQDISVNDLSLDLSLNKKHKLVIFIHGLLVDEKFWQHNSHDMPGYGQLIEDDLQMTVLYLRYSTGSHISDNGKKLAKLMEKVFLKYQKNIDEINFITHSMGGLVLRSACYYAQQDSLKWINKINHTFLIGVPSSGASLEQFSHVSTLVLERMWFLSGRLVAKFINQRSDGIRDLRAAIMLQSDWEKNNSWHIHPKTTPVPPLPGVKYHVIAGSLAKTESNPMNDILGDGIVSLRSSYGKRILKDQDPVTKVATLKFFPGVNHYRLTRDKSVYQYVKSVLQGE